MTRSDFNCPNTYQLNLLKTNARSTVRAFLPKQNRTKLTFKGEKGLFQPIEAEFKSSHIENDQALAAYHEKFLNNAPLSSQLTLTKGRGASQTVDLRQEQTAMKYTLPKARAWRK